MSILGKFATKAMKKDTSGAVKAEVEHLTKMREMVTKKKDELEKISKSGKEDDKYYSKMEIDRRSENKDMVKSLKEKEKEGALTKKQVENRADANKKRPMSSDSIRDSIQKQVDRESDDMDFNKGGMAKKKTAGKPMMYGGAVAKELPKRGSRTATNMAKGGSVAKKAKK